MRFPKPFLAQKYFLFIHSPICIPPHGMKLILWCFDSMAWNFIPPGGMKIYAAASWHRGASIINSYKPSDIQEMLTMSIFDMGNNLTASSNLHCKWQTYTCGLFLHIAWYNRCKIAPFFCRLSYNASYLITNRWRDANSRTHC